MSALDVVLVLTLLGAVVVVARSLRDTTSSGVGAVVGVAVALLASLLIIGGAS